MRQLIAANVECPSILYLERKKKKKSLFQQHSLAAQIRNLIIFCARARRILCVCARQLIASVCVCVSVCEHVPAEVKAKIA